MKIALKLHGRHHPREQCEPPTLAGENSALIFERDSNRTRGAFEVAAHDQGE